MESVIGGGVGIDFGDVGIFDLFQTVHIYFSDFVDFYLGAFHFCLKSNEIIGLVYIKSTSN